MGVQIIPAIFIVIVIISNLLIDTSYPASSYKKVKVTNTSTSVSDPGVCNCANNAMKAGTIDFNQSLQDSCANYANTLTQSQKENRVREAINCL